MLQHLRIKATKHHLTRALAIALLPLAIVLFVSLAQSSQAFAAVNSSIKVKPPVVVSVDAHETLGLSFIDANSFSPIPLAGQQAGIQVSPLAKTHIEQGGVISTIESIFNYIINATVYFPARTFQEAIEKASRNIFTGQMDLIRGPLGDVINVFAFTNNAVFGNIPIPPEVRDIGRTLTRAAVPLWGLSLVLLGLAVLTRSAVGMGYGTNEVASELARWLFIALSSGNAVAIVSLVHTGFGSLTYAIASSAGRVSATEMVEAFMPHAGLDAWPILLIVIAAIIGFVTIIVLAITYVARFAMMLAITALAPIAVACEGIPFTRFVFRDWLSMFLRMEFLQIINVTILVIFKSLGFMMLVRGNAVTQAIMLMVVMIGLSSAIIGVNISIFKQVFGVAMDVVAQMKAAGEQFGKAVTQVAGVVAGAALTAASGGAAAPALATAGMAATAGGGGSSSATGTSASGAVGGLGGDGSSSSDGMSAAGSYARAFSNLPGPAGSFMKGFAGGASAATEMSNRRAATARLQAQQSASETKRGEMLAREMGAGSPNDISAIAKSVTEPKNGVTRGEMTQAYRDKADLLRSMAREYGSPARAAAVSGYKSFSEMAESMAHERIREQRGASGAGQQGTAGPNGTIPSAQSRATTGTLQAGSMVDAERAAMPAGSGMKNGARPATPYVSPSTAATGQKTVDSGVSAADGSPQSMVNGLQPGASEGSRLSNDARPTNPTSSSSTVGTTPLSGAGNVASMYGSQPESGVSTLLGVNEGNRTNNDVSSRATRATLASATPSTVMSRSAGAVGDASGNSTFVTNGADVHPGIGESREGSQQSISQQSNNVGQFVPAGSSSSSGLQHSDVRTQSGMTPPDGNGLSNGQPAQVQSLIPSSAVQVPGVMKSSGDDAAIASSPLPTGANVSTQPVLASGASNPSTVTASALATHAPGLNQNDVAALPQPSIEPVVSGQVLQPALMSPAVVGNASSQSDQPIQTSNTSVPEGHFDLSGERGSSSPSVGGPFVLSSGQPATNTMTPMPSSAMPAQPQFGQERHASVEHSTQSSSPLPYASAMPAQANNAGSSSVDTSMPSSSSIPVTSTPLADRESEMVSPSVTSSIPPPTPLTSTTIPVENYSAPSIESAFIDLQQPPSAIPQLLDTGVTRSESSVPTDHSSIHSSARASEISWQSAASPASSPASGLSGVISSESPIGASQVQTGNQPLILQTESGLAERHTPIERPLDYTIPAAANLGSDTSVVSPVLHQSGAGSVAVLPAETPDSNYGLAQTPSIPTQQSEMAQPRGDSGMSADRESSGAVLGTSPAQSPLQLSENIGATGVTSSTTGITAQDTPPGFMAGSPYGVLNDTPVPMSQPVLNSTEVSTQVTSQGEMSFSEQHEPSRQPSPQVITTAHPSETFVPTPALSTVSSNNENDQSSGTVMIGSSVSPQSDGPHLDQSALVSDRAAINGIGEQGSMPTSDVASTARAVEPRQSVNDWISQIPNAPIQEFIRVPPHLSSPGEQSMLPFDFGIGARLTYLSHSDPTMAPLWAQTAHSLRMAYGESYVKDLVDRTQSEALNETQLRALVEGDVENNSSARDVALFWKANTQTDQGDQSNITRRNNRNSNRR